MSGERDRVLLEFVPDRWPIKFYILCHKVKHKSKPSNVNTSV